MSKLNPSFYTTSYPILPASFLISRDSLCTNRRPLLLINPKLNNPRTFNRSLKTPYSIFFRRTSYLAATNLYYLKLVNVLMSHGEKEKSLRLFTKSLVKTFRTSSVTKNDPLTPYLTFLSSTLKNYFLYTEPRDKPGYFLPSQ